MHGGMPTNRRKQQWGRVVVGGAVAAATSALVYKELRRRSQRDYGSITVRRAVTIRADASELYQVWRRLSNLPQLMPHLKSVTEESTTVSHWVASGPVGPPLSWDAEITRDEPNQRITWRSINGAVVAHAGSVRFEPAPDGRGTEVHVQLSYYPPAGPIGAAIAKLLGDDPDRLIREDLRRFKQSMEAGEVATTDGQPHGRT
jgi:uncharacterized membrane protein